MTEKETKELKPGDKVRIVSKRTESDHGDDHWAVLGGMDKYLGKIMTVAQIGRAHV